MAPETVVLTTQRLVLEPWTADDAADGLAIFGHEKVTRWLAPAMAPIRDESEMRAAIERWGREDSDVDPPVGHWAVRSRDGGDLLGSVTLRRMPPHQEDLELAWQFVPDHWGQGYATEAARAVADWAFRNSAHELFAVTRPANQRAERLARRLGMQWVGETDKYYGLRLQAFRLWPSDLAGTSTP
jgi:[ribosomal protein S5]-alanine N-acetyltransferase